MRRVVKNIFTLLIFAVFILLIIFLLVRFAPQPPVSEMEYARKSISEAVARNAGAYSGKLFSEARVLYDSAMKNWQKENEKFIYFRNYDKVTEFAELSAKKADQATASSKKNSANLEIKLKQKIDSLNNLIVDFDRLFKTYPLTSEFHGRFSRGKLLLKESEVAYKKEQYLQSNIKMTDAEYLLTSSYENARTNLREYFSSYPEWEKWVDKAIKDSRKNHSYSIIIDKFSRKCVVYLSGNKKYEYQVELGKNWIGDKREKGDNATPEGMYRITKKIDRGRTKYYKALLINYPNEQDKEEFRQEIASGSLRPSAKIGGLIEIHGSGGRGVDWTEGCIALHDAEMDVVYKIANTGTPVTIVGSMIPLKDILNR